MEPKALKMEPNRYQNGVKMVPKWNQNRAQIRSGGQLEGKPFAGNLADPLAGTSSSTLSHGTFFKGTARSWLCHLDPRGALAARKARVWPAAPNLNLGLHLTYLGLHLT